MCISWIKKNQVIKKYTLFYQYRTSIVIILSENKYNTKLFVWMLLYGKNHQLLNKDKAMSGKMKDTVI